MFKRFIEKVDRMMGRGVLDEAFYEELEEELLLADTHAETVRAILDELRRAIREEKITEPAEIRGRLEKAISSRFAQEEKGLAMADDGPTLYVFVGVNGVGKTTSIGKLAAVLQKKGFKVLLAAGDTFRAAAIDQLAVWAEKAGVEIVKGQPGADPASVIFDAITSAKAKGIDFILADTAGRQHSKDRLMQELAKIARSCEKGLGRKPDEVLLVLDANTGQNAIRQAEEFKKAAGITGLVLTKLDGTSRGGALIGVYDRLKIPIKLIGTGEKIGDLKDFKPAEFAKGLFD